MVEFPFWFFRWAFCPRCTGSFDKVESDETVPRAPFFGAKQTGRTKTADSDVKSAIVGYDGRQWQFSAGFDETHGKLHGLPKKVLIFPMFIAFRHTPAVGCLPFLSHFWTLQV